MFNFACLSLLIGYIFLFVFGVIDELFRSALSLTSGYVRSTHNLIRLSLEPRLAARSAVSSVVPIVVINLNLEKLPRPPICGCLKAVWGQKQIL